jgi:hypothetical protein
MNTGRRIVSIFLHRIHPLTKSRVTIMIPADWQFYYLIDEQSGREIPVLRSDGFWRLEDSGWRKVPSASEAMGGPDLVVSLSLDLPFDTGFRHALCNEIYERESKNGKN